MSNPPKPKPPKGYPFEKGKHLWDYPELWNDSPLNPANWPPSMKPQEVNEFIKEQNERAKKQGGTGQTD